MENVGAPFYAADVEVTAGNIVCSGIFQFTFKEAGHDVCVLAPSNGEEEKEGLIGFKNVPLKSKSSLNRLMNQFSIGFNSVKAAKKFGKADVVILGNNNGNIVGAASQNAIDSEIKINEIIKTAAGVLGGGGGGRLTLAQGAGKNTEKMPEAIQTAIDLIKG